APIATTRRASLISANPIRSGSFSSGQPARKTESGPSNRGCATRVCQRCSTRKGMTGEITRSACTRPCQRTRIAVASPAQERLRAVQPAHDVRAHPVERLVQLDRVASRLVHRLAALVKDLLVRE